MRGLTPPTGLRPPHHCSKWYLIVGLLLGLMTATASPSRAGNYLKIFEEGGVCSHAGGGTTPYYAVADGFGCDSTPDSGTASATGDIGCIWLWMPEYPGEKPPKSVIVTETCTASATGVGPSPTTAADNGLGATNNINLPGFSRSTSTHYKVINGSDLLFTFCSPSATASSGPTPNSTTEEAAYVSIAYSITLDPVQIGLTGPTLFGNSKHILTGQNITADMSAAYQLLVGKSWSLDGADICFGEFKITDTPGIPATPTTLAIPGVHKSEVIAVDLTVDQPSFYTKANGAVTVKCSATVLFPDGTSDTVSAESAQVTSDKPGGKFDIFTGAIRLRIDDTHGDFGLLGSLKDLSITEGQTWIGGISYPPAFANASGSYGFAQVVESSVRTTNVGGVIIPKSLPGPLPALDGAFLYKNIEPPTVGETKTGDSPGSDNIVNPLSPVTVTITRTDKFQTWLMFKPTGGAWVPIKQYKWTWTGFCDYDPGTQKWTASGTRPPNTPKAEDTTEHPIWYSLAPDLQ